jgi:hypothetical protein
MKLLVMQFLHPPVTSRTYLSEWFIFMLHYVFRAICQSLQANTTIVPALAYDSFLQNPLQFIIHQSIHNLTLSSLL